MKHSILFLLAFGFPALMMAQKTEKRAWRQSEEEWARKNSISVNLSLVGPTNYGGMAILPLTVEYDHIISTDKNLSVSGIGIGSIGGESIATDIYKMRENFFFVGAKLNKNWPVVRNRIYFRAGIGAGMGIHHVTEYVMGMGSEASAPPLETHVKPHAMIDAYWVFRVSPKTELRFAPLFISPSQFIVGSKFDEPYNNSVYFYTNVATFGMNFRF
jgi:hypothetical protein